MICKICGANLPDDVSFCPACGQNMHETPIVEGENAQDILQAEKPSINFDTTTTIDNMPDFEQATTTVAVESALPSDAVLTVAKKANKKIFLIIGAIVAILAIGVVAFFAIILNTPTMKVFGAFAKTSKTIVSEIEILKKNIPIDKVFSELAKGTMQVDFSANVKEISGVSGMTAGISSSTLFNQTDKQFVSENTFDMIIAKFDFAIQAQDNLLAITCPKLFEGAVGFDSMNIEPDMAKASESILEFFPYTENFEIFAETTDNTKMLTAKEYATINTMIDDFKQEVTFDIVKSTKTTAVNGVDVNCKEYTANISSEKTSRLFVDILDLMCENEAFWTGVTATTGDMDKSEFLAMYEDIFDYFDDYSVNVFVSDGKVVRFTLETEISDVLLAIDFQLGNGKYMLNDIGCFVGLQDDYDNISIEIKSVGDHIGNNKMYTDNTTITVVDNSSIEQTKVLSATTKYDMTKTKDNLLFEAKMSDRSEDVLTLSATGNMVVNKAKKEFAIDMPSILFDMEYLGESGELGFNISAKPGEITEDMLVSSDKVKNVLKFSDDEFNSFLLEVMINLRTNYPIFFVSESY